MDAAQITGSASSYAGSTPLMGLFLIDDTKDPDATNDHGNPREKGKRRARPAETIELAINLAKSEQELDRHLENPKSYRKSEFKEIVSPKEKEEL